MDLLEDTRIQFARIAALPSDQIDTAQAALIIARIKYPNLDTGYYLRWLDHTADRLAVTLDGNDGPAATLDKLNRIFFEEEGFCGNRQNYYDPDNSFLNRVIERKLGIPITLSLVYMEIGRRVNLNLQGISMPGHFLTALYTASGRIFIDVFNRGEVLTETECRRMLRDRRGVGHSFESDWLDPVGPKQVLSRLLRNLKAIYMSLNDDLSAFQMVHWILTLIPDAGAELRERAAFYEKMGNYEGAVRDLERYRANISDVEEKTKIEIEIDRLKGRQTLLH